MNKPSRQKLRAVSNGFVERIIEEYAALCAPARITVLDDSEQDRQYARRLSLANREETALAMRGHSVHFDGMKDQGRDLVNTRVLLSPGATLSKSIETVGREQGLKEILGLLDGIMRGKEMLVKFYCLGPCNSRFCIPALQLTDSAYVVHSEDLLYRQGFGEFKRLRGGKNFFHFVHSAGVLQGNVCRDICNRRVYIDLEKERVLTVNNQYPGNSVGLKKLALRLAISKAHREDWLCEHMFILGAKPAGKNRVTYFSGAFPSACGKTSTAMILGQTIVGDDIAYIMPGKDGRAWAANVECGIFGIIEDVNSADEPAIYSALTTPRELIFSNVLVKDSVPYWLGMGKELPECGANFSGDWFSGKKDDAGKEILPAHKNARYTISLKGLENVDPNLDSPEGVPVSGFIYGGRDSDTSVPVLQSLSWAHGVFIGAVLESETTAATLGAAGVRKHNPMSNIEFLTVPLGVYIENHLKFGSDLDSPPLVFATNYFLKEGGRLLNQKTDKKVWLMWMEGRVHNEFNAIETPMGFIPVFEDLRRLFREIFNKEYPKADYEKQFSVRAKKLLEKLDRVEAVFKEEDNIPEAFCLHLAQERERLAETMKKFGKETISPFELCESR
ncbi:MAG: phosphoenolpyruvate carboxykinase (GTP) [Candidatus Diapherotrites archaeon]|nr:phosphoenolpyruvate carboxykinase (GTP) [Candidatus Diapherotrites archaeon]